jgi:general secretion pathway protein G
MVKVRKGFTLVELLIVIVIIGILAGGMMLASGAATATATATTIVSDLRSLAGAAVMFYADNLTANTQTVVGISSLYKYMGDSKKIAKESQNYKFVINSAGWWVGYSGGKLVDNNVKEKLAARASDIGIYTTSDGSAVFTSAESAAYLKAR